MLKHFPKFLILFLFAASPACANDINYVDPKIISPEFISPPLEVKGDEYSKEAESIISLQKTATKEDLATASDEYKLAPKHFLTVLDKEANENSKPKTFALMTKVKSDCEKSVHQAKDFWHTKRPHLSDSRIKSLIAPHTSYAYPSGHTACSRVWAEVLSQITPEKRSELRAKAKQSAQYRVLTGQHWPHDVAGGEQIALIFFGALQTSPAYQADLKSAQTEWGNK